MNDFDSLAARLILAGSLPSQILWRRRDDKSGSSCSSSLDGRVWLAEAS